MTMRKKILVSGTVLLGLAAAGGGLTYYYSRPGEDILAGRKGAGASAGASAGRRIPGAGGGPLFRFGNAYLDGRSVWLAARFREAREAARTAPVPPDTAIECIVHRKPFTQGSWVETLPEDLARQRTEVEGQAVETHVTFLVPGGAARAVLRYMVGSNLLGRLPDEGTVVRTLAFPPLEKPPEWLRSVPELGSNEWVSRDQWSRTLAFPTDVAHLHSVFMDGDAAAEVMEAWENVPGDGKAAVRLGSTQYVVAPRPGGALVRITSYYSGQGIPPLMDGFVTRMTTTFFKKLAALVQKEAMTWTAPPDLAPRLDALGL
jgi:hypothetical protein